MIIFLMFISTVAFAADSQFDSDAIFDIQVTPNSTLEFKAEKIHITPKLVTMEYEFLNLGKDFEAEINFPLPDLAPNGYLNQFVPEILKFKASVDGIDLPYPIKHKAIFKGKDITAELEKLKITYPRYYPIGSMESIRVATERGWTFWEKELEDFEDEKSPMVNVVYPNFKPIASFGWKQKFLKDKVTKIKLAYVPNLGFMELGDLRNWETFRNLISPRDFDLESGTAEYAADQKKMAAYHATVQNYYLRFHLPNTTNWSKGIENFELKVDGTALIFLYMSGEVMSDFTPLLVQKKNFKPTGEAIVNLIDLKNGQLSRDIPYTKKVDGPANCRKSPSGALVVSIPQGAPVLVRARKEDWYLVTYVGKDCWTKKNNLPTFDYPSPEPKDN
jgi:hypothetical protein